MKKCLDIRLAKYCWDEPGNLKYCVITALNKKTDKEIGTIRYNVFKRTITIDMIEVDKEFRRCGVASRMLNKLKKEYPKINYGLTTREGAEFLRRYKLEKRWNA